MEDMEVYAYVNTKNIQNMASSKVLFQMRLCKKTGFRQNEFYRR